MVPENRKSIHVYAIAEFYCDIDYVIKSGL